MTITEAIRKLTDLLGEHGNLQLVDGDGDLMDFNFCPEESDFKFPHDVILVEYIGD